MAPPLHPAHPPPPRPRAHIAPPNPAFPAQRLVPLLHHAPPPGRAGAHPQNHPHGHAPLSPATGWCLDPDERALSLSSIAFARPTHANVQAQCWPLCSMRRMPQGASV